MKLNEQTSSLRRSTSISKSLRGVRSIGSRKPKVQDVAIDLRAEYDMKLKAKFQDVAIDVRRDNDNDDDKSNGSIIFSFDLDGKTPRRDPPPPKLIRKGNFSKKKAKATTTKSGQKQSQEHKKVKTPTKKTLTVVSDTALEVQAPKNDNQRLVTLEEAKEVNQGESTTTTTAATSSQEPIHAPAIASAAAVAAVANTQAGQDGFDPTENIIAMDATEKYYSKLEAAQQKHEEELEYLFQDVDSAYSFSDDSITFQEERGEQEFGRTRSQMVDIDFIIEDEELKREVFGDDIHSIHTLNTDVTAGERWGTGFMDFALLLCA